MQASQKPHSPLSFLSDMTRVGGRNEKSLIPRSPSLSCLVPRPRLLARTNIFRIPHFLDQAIFCITLRQSCARINGILTAGVNTYF
jgi:hypothetical protein